MLLGPGIALSGAQSILESCKILERSTLFVGDDLDSCGGNYGYGPLPSQNIFGAWSSNQMQSKNARWSHARIDCVSFAQIENFHEIPAQVESRSTLGWIPHPAGDFSERVLVASGIGLGIYHL